MDCNIGVQLSIYSATGSSIFELIASAANLAEIKASVIPSPELGWTSPASASIL